MNTSSRWGNTPLHHAALIGDPCVIASLLLRGADARATNASGETPLHYSARNGHTDATAVLVKHLLETLAHYHSTECFIDDLQRRDSNGRTPLEDDTSGVLDAARARCVSSALRDLWRRSGFAPDR